MESRQFPRVQPEREITCERKRCGTIFYRTPGARGFVIFCPNRKCPHKGYVRADEQSEAESLWAKRLLEQEAS